jgi:hypothetical protein
MSKDEKDTFAADAERALQEAVADVIEEHRRGGKLIVVARDGKPVKVDPNTVRTVREERARYGHIHNERNEI